jgi:hypothetical protein
VYMCILVYKCILVYISVLYVPAEVTRTERARWPLPYSLNTSVADSTGTRRVGEPERCVYVV